MKRNLFFILLLIITFVRAKAQDPTTYIREHAVRINNPENLSDSVYNLLSAFQIIMVGEMHGTNEPAKFTIGLTELLTNKGDSVQVGLEIPSEYMTKYISEHTDSSIYHSEFFASPPYEDGKETYACAGIISTLNNNPKVEIFFYDINNGDTKYSYQRDSIMYLKIKKQFQEHPQWKMVTLSGNIHNMTSPENNSRGNTMASYLKKDAALNLADKICSLNLFYVSGSMLADFGNGLELKTVDDGDNILSQAVPWNYYIMMANPKKNYPYTGIFFTKNITAGEMVNSK